MKVLVLGHSAGQIGGVSNFLRLMKQKGPTDVDLDLMTVGPRDGEKRDHNRFVRLFLDYLAFVGRMFRHYDCVHMNPSLDKSSFVRTLVFALICVVFRKKFIVFFRGWDWNAYRYFFERDTAYTKSVRSLLKHASCFIVLAPDFKNALQRFYPKHEIHVITTMFDGTVMPPEGPKNFDSPQMLFMSRFLPAKGGAQAIDALVELAKKYPGATLRMAGDGPAKADWEAHAAKYGTAAEGVKFIGYIKAETKTAALEQSNIFVMPTVHPEGMPNALMEAMGAGLIPVITQAGGTFDAIKFGELGYMLKDQEPAGIVEAVSAIMADRAHSTDMAKEVRIHAWKTFESMAVINRIAEIYRSVSAA